MTLLNNAVEASPAQVVVGAREQDGLLLVEVADSGPGLGGKQAGWGVGLELAQAALARLGGRLELLDLAPGGVLARAYIPLAEVPT
jgi:signal transduction histidine kinase